MTQSVLFSGDPVTVNEYGLLLYSAALLHEATKRTQRYWHGQNISPTVKVHSNGLNVPNSMSYSHVDLSLKGCCGFILSFISFSDLNICKPTKEI